MNNYYHFIIMDLIRIKYPDIKNIYINEIYEIDPGYTNTSIAIDCTITIEPESNNYVEKYPKKRNYIIVNQEEYKMILRDYKLKKIGV